MTHALSLTFILTLFAALGTSGTAHACPVDPASPGALRVLTDTAFVSVSDASTRMTCLRDALHLRGDRRSVFLAMYVRTTEEIEARIAAGEFLDSAWTGRYLVAFADLYRRAFSDYERGARFRVPPAWLAAFDASRRGDALVLQELLLGMNAHVNADLALALYGTRIDPDRENKYLDHLWINDILQSIFDEQLALISALYAPGLANLPTAVTDLSEGAFFFSLRTGRENAWRHAEQLTAARSEWERMLIRGWLQTEAAGVAAGVLAPALSPALMETLRGLERGAGM